MTDPAQPPAIPTAPAAGQLAPVALEPQRRGLGIFALILGLGAVLVDIIFFVVVVVQGASVFAAISAGDFSSVGLTFAGIAGIGLVIFFGGLLVSLLAVILGLVAAVRRRGRAAGVFAVIFGAIALISRIVVITTLAGSGALLSQLFTGGS